MQLTDEQFEKFSRTTPYVDLCKKFGISTDDDEASNLRQAARTRFFAESDALAAEYLR